MRSTTSIENVILFSTTTTVSPASFAAHKARGKPALAGQGRR